MHKSNFLFAGLIALAAATAPGCGALDASCDFRTTKSEPRCQERLASLGAPAFKATCNAVGGKGQDGPCERAGIVAGCDIGTQGDGSHVVDWYYAPKTVDDVKKECVDDNGTFKATP